MIKMLHVYLNVKKVKSKLLFIFNHYIRIIIRIIINAPPLAYTYQNNKMHWKSSYTYAGMPWLFTGLTFPSPTLDIMAAVI